MVLGKVLLFLGNNTQTGFGKNRHWAHKYKGHTDHTERQRLTEGRINLALLPLTPFPVLS